jgi:hypothetical protein
LAVWPSPSNTSIHLPLVDEIRVNSSTSVHAYNTGSVIGNEFAPSTQEHVACRLPSRTDVLSRARLNRDRAEADRALDHWTVLLQNN